MCLNKNQIRKHVTKMNSPNTAEYAIWTPGSSYSNHACYASCFLPASLYEFCHTLWSVLSVNYEKITSPREASTALVPKIEHLALGSEIEWHTRSGFSYLLGKFKIPEISITNLFSGNWADVTAPRLLSSLHFKREQKTAPWRKRRAHVKARLWRQYGCESLLE